MRCTEQRSSWSGSSARSTRWALHPSSKLELPANIMDVAGEVSAYRRLGRKQALFDGARASLAQEANAQQNLERVADAETLQVVEAALARQRDDPESMDLREDLEWAEHGVLEALRRRCGHLTVRHVASHARCKERSG